MVQRCTLDEAVDLLMSTLDGPILLGLPLGLGKPNRLVNALYQRIAAQPERALTLFTALSLGRPRAEGDLQARFLDPFVERIYADYPELDYLHALRDGSLPANVRVEEFYLQPGSLLDSPSAQQHYISCNYSHVARDINAKGLNAVAQLVARDPSRPGKLSLACNPDITLDLVPLLQRRRDAGERIVAIGVVHDDLPYMPGDAEVDEDLFDLLVDAGERTRLFSTPNLPVSLQDHGIGLHASVLVRDGGTLQIGIGSMGDAVTSALLARHRDNPAYQALLADLDIADRHAEMIEREGGLEPFQRGLYGCSEMFVPGLLALAEAGVMRRHVHRDAQVQEAVDAGEARDGGVWLHGGFFLGPQDFYRRLRDIVVTEYGIADLRGRNDAEVIAALLRVADSRFQDKLIEQAQAVGKLPRDFVLDAHYRNNLPERLAAVHQRHRDLLPEYPLGSDFSEHEQDLLRALTWLKSKLKLSEILELGKATLDAPAAEQYPEHLQRMGLEHPDGLREELYQRLLLAGLHASDPARSA